MLDFKVFMSRTGGGKSLIYNHLGRIHTDSLDTSGPLDGVYPRPAGLSVCADNPFIYRSVMKKVLMFASAAIAALAMVSCNKEIETPESLAGEVCPEGYYIEELEATYPVDPATRTAFNETSGKFAWTEGDELAFHLSNGTYTSAPIDPATSKVKLYLPVGVTRDNYAVYPASAVVEEAAEIGNMQVTLPSTYDISGNLTTDYVPMPLIATNNAENKNLKFEHVGALLQVNLNVPAGVKTAKLSMGKTITGTFDLAAGSGNGVIEAGSVSDDALTFVLSEEGLSAETAVKLLAPLPSGTYDKFEVAYDNGFAFTKDLSSKPWEFDRTQGKKVSIAEENFEDPTNYFWFEALEAGSVVTFVSATTASYSNALEYSFDKRTWTEYDKSDVTLENVGDRVYFRGRTNESWCKTYYNGSYSTRTLHHRVSESWITDKFRGSGQLKVGGEVMSLVKNGGKLQFQDLFRGNKALVDASELVLPDYTDSFCYYGMFYGCTGLVAPPELPATELSVGCYEHMFSNCGKSIVGENGYTVVGYSGLKAVPALPATVMKDYCYAYMFAYSSAIESVPTDYLPSIQLADGCYAGMFFYSYSLENIPNLPATKMYDYCYYEMFDSDRKITRCLSILPAMELAPYCYSNMFHGCSKMENACTLPATVLAKNCYEYMFASCDALKLSDHGVYVLPAETLCMSCYDHMFNQTSFYTDDRDKIVIEIMATDIDYYYSMRQMFLTAGTGNYFTIIVHFTEWPTNASRRATYEWMYGRQGGQYVNCDGAKFIKPAALSGEYTSVLYSGASSKGQDQIPYKWTVCNLEEVGAGI